MVVLGGFIFEDIVLWVFVSEGGRFAVLMDGDTEKDEDTGLGCEKRMGTLGKSKNVPGRFYESQWEKDQSRKGAPRENSCYVVPICFPR